MPNELSPIDRLKLQLQLRNRQTVPPEQAAANRRQTGYDVLSMLPGPGNVIAAKDAVQGTGRAVDAFGRGDYGTGAKESGLAALSGLGAVLGLPVGKLARGVSKGASSRANVFVPIGGKKSDKARELVQQNVPEHEIYGKTKRLIGSQGQTLEEIPDYAMTFKSRDASNLGDLIDHPKLFSRFPELKNIPIKWTNRAEPGRGQPVIRTNPETGAFEISTLAQGDLRAPIAKLLQYRIAEMTNMPRALRHSSPLPELEKAAVQAAESGSPHAGQYIRRLHEEKNEFLENVNRIGKAKADDTLAHKSAGNIDAKIAAARAKLEPEKVESVFPYSRSAPYLKRAKHQRMPANPKVLPIPQEKMTTDQVAEFLENWRKYGSGRPQFADGGSVGTEPKRVVANLAGGAIDGNHGGREDTRAVTLPEGGYVIPADIVAALGDGNTAAGFEKLTKRFGSKKRQNMRHGGGIKASVSDGEFVVSPDQIGKIPGGHDALDNFVKQVRQHNIRKLASLPDPKK